MRRARRRTAAQSCASPVVPSITVQRRAGVIDEHPLAGDMALPHGRRQPPLPGAIELAVTAIAVAVGVDGAMLLPQQLQRHALAGAARGGSPPSPAAVADPWPRPWAADRAGAPAPRRSARPAAARSSRHAAPAACSPRPPSRPSPRLAAILRLDMPAADSLSTSRILRMGNLGPGMSRSLRKEPKQCRFADHPTAPVTPVHRLVAIARNGWSRSIGTAGRNQSE